MLFRRVEVHPGPDGETAEPVQFVGTHVLRWPEGILPTAAFVEDEDATARLTAADALVEKANGAILAMSAAQTYIEENRGGLSNDTTRRLQMAIDALDAALDQYREAAR